MTPRRLAPLLLLVAACTSTTLHFQPIGQQPLRVPGVAATVRAAVLAPEDDAEALTVRFVIDDRSGRGLRVDADALRLASGDLAPFGPAQVLTTRGRAGAITTDVAFPFPEVEEVDLATLYLDWGLVGEDGARFSGAGASFRGVAKESGWGLTPDARIGIGPRGPVWSTGVRIR